ncbi:hypothetical protein [Parvularcula sp. IMCC14364]|uniref:hypothetical protein n=1 Tax=Parvularcula sp. IMCC14364 TaxID=3067902 RepID=UPI002740EB8C|nr:hypothetical protein [Parvularcula sp. IMCC14364]
MSDKSLFDRVRYALNRSFSEDVETLRIYGFQPDMLPDDLVLRKDTRAIFILVGAALFGLLVTLGFTVFFGEGGLDEIEFDFDVLLGPAIALLISPLISLIVERFSPDDLLLDREGFKIQGSMEEKVMWRDTTTFEVAGSGFMVSQVITYIPTEQQDIISKHLLQEDTSKITINAVYGKLDAEDLARVMNAYRGKAIR